MHIEMDKTYLVLDLTEKEQKKARLKASVYALSVENLFKKAINTLEAAFDTIECPYCVLHISRVLCDEEKVIQVGDRTLKMIVHNYPKYVCHNCSSDYDDLRISMYLLELLRMEMIECLQKGEPFPQRVDFNDFITF